MNDIIALKEQKWTDADLPQVSVSCFTYNHKKYVEETLKSFLNQKTNFRVEILIHDDASTDGTQEILQYYEIQFPWLFNVVYQTENQFSQIGMEKMAHRQRSRARAKYYAICEGDDYWVDELKLQSQFDMMEFDSTFSGCFHSTFYLSGTNKVVKRPLTIKNYYTIQDVILHGGRLISTNSVFCRTQDLIEVLDWEVKSPVNDILLILYLGLKGKLAYIDKPMSVYRVMSDQSWSSRIRFDKVYRRNHNKKMICMWKDFNKFTHNKYVLLVYYKILRKYFSDFKNNIVYSFK